MNETPVSAHIRAAFDTVSAEERPALERAEALVEMAFDLIKKPKTPQELLDALFLYGQAADLAQEHPLARARALLGQASTYRRLPGAQLDTLIASRDAYEEALPVLREAGEAEELAEAEMGYGLVLQTLASAGKAPLPQAVQAYHRALKTFTKERYPREFAILHNNIATAYLSMTLSPEREVVREALAVQSFLEALKVVRIEDDPTEYAMLQNNLGNALQAMRSSHPLENLARAVEAYDEALRVRTQKDMPLEYANTVANKANALMNLPDDPQDLDAGNPNNLVEAARLLGEASALFQEHGLHDRAQMVGEVLASLAPDLPQPESPS